jgi:hypothetical protein
MPKTETKPIMRWMKKNIGLGASIAHFVLREENGMYITTCGKATVEAKFWVDLTDDEMVLVTYDPKSRCGMCKYSWRSLKPENT